MKKMLNEWKKFLNENEREDLTVRKMTPAGDLEFFEMIMGNDDSYIVKYNPSNGEAMVYMHHDAGGDLAAAALKYIQQDAPYDQDRFPEDGEKDPDKVSQARTDGTLDAQDAGNRGDKWEGGPYFEEYEDAYNNELDMQDRQDYYDDLEGE